MPNPIYTSDIIKDDGAITKTKDELIALEKVYNGFVNKIEQQSIRLEGSLSKVSVGASAGREEVSKGASQASELVKEWEKFNALQTETAEKIALVKKAQAEQNKINKLSADINSATSGSMENMNAKLKLAKTELDKMRKSQKENTAEGKKLQAQYERLTLQIKQQKDEQRMAIKVRELERKAAESAEGSYNRLSAQYSLAKIKLNAMSAEQRKTTATGQKLEKESKAIYNEMKRLQEVTGKNTLNVGNYADAMSGLPGPIGMATSSMTTLGSAMKRLASNPLLLVLMAIVGAFALIRKAMTRSEEGQDRLNKITTVASSIWDNLMDVVTEIGVALFDWLPKAFEKGGNKIKIFFKDMQVDILQARIAWNEFIGNSEKAEKLGEGLKEAVMEVVELKKANTELDKEMEGMWDKAVGKIKGFREELKADVKAAGELADMQAQYNKQERAYLVGNAKLAGESAKLRAEAEALKYTHAEEGIKKMDEALNKEKEIADNEVKLAEIRAEMLRRESALASDDIEMKKQIAQAEADIFNARARADEKERERTKRLNIFRMQAFKQQTNRMKVELDAAKLESERKIELNDRIIENEKKTQEEGLKAAEDNKNLRIKFTEEEFDIAKSLLDKELELKLKNQEDYNAELLLLEKTLANDRAEINDQYKDDISEISDKQLAQNLEAFEQQLAIEESEFNLHKHTELEKTKFTMEQEKARIQFILDNAKNLSEEQIKILKNQLQATQNEIDGLSEKGKAENLFDVFGINLDPDQEQALQDAYGRATAYAKEYLSKLVEAQDQKIQAADKDIESITERLEQEKDLRDQGFANNVETEEKKLKLAEESRQQAIREKRKYQQIQLAMDSIEQASSLITASANIWKSWSKVPGIGQVLAIAAIGTMWGSFALSKVKAFQLTRQQYGEGGYEDFDYGGSHASGNDIPLGMTKDGRQRTVEKGESMAIFNRKAVQRNGSRLRSFVNAINQGREHMLFNRADAMNVPVNITMEAPKKYFIEKGKQYVEIDGDGKILGQIEIL